MSERTPELIRKEIHKFDRTISKYNSIAWILIVVGGVVFGAGLWHLAYPKEDGVDPFSWGVLASLGSFYQGAVGSLWSLASFLFIYVAFLGQKQQMLEQEVDNIEQREQFKIQHQSIRLQSFESAFFHLLSLHNEIVSSLEWKNPYGSELKRGRDAFEHMYAQLVNWQFPPHATSGVTKYENYYKDNQGVLGHYFRNLYHLIKFVAGHDALAGGSPDEEYTRRRRYTSLVRAQLSAYELPFLFYNGLSRYGSNKMKPLIETFGLLENLDETLLLRGPSNVPSNKGINPQADKAGYDESAFK